MSTLAPAAVRYFRSRSFNETHDKIYDLAARVSFNEHRNAGFAPCFAALMFVVEEKAAAYKRGSDCLDYRGLLARLRIIEKMIAQQQ